MQVKRYVAVDMGEALKMVKANLGQNAIILQSRKVRKGKGAFGLFARPVVEVTAALPATNQNVRKNKYIPHRSKVYVRKRAPAENENSGYETLGPVIDGLEEIRDSLSALTASKDGPATDVERISGDVREMKSMISHLIDNSEINKDSRFGRHYQALMRILKDRGVATEYVRAICEDIKEKVGEGPEPDIKTLIRVTAARMRDSMFFGGAVTTPAPDEEKPKVITLIGPTGVGKTTTIAKLASNLSLGGARVGLITIDTFRIAAVEQLKIYAKILEIPLEVVLSPGDLGHAIDKYRDKDVVLIDTAGRSQRDMAQISELTRFFEKNENLDIRLVLSAAASEGQMDEAVKNFSRLNLSGFIFTKLDEAASLGPVFNLQLKTGLPISHFTTGQCVPEDMEEATGKAFIHRFFKTGQ